MRYIYIEKKIYVIKDVWRFGNYCCLIGCVELLLGECLGGLVWLCIMKCVFINI